jgi:hypothetical protein
MDGETVIGIIPQTEVRPGLSDYDLVVTNKRIIGGKVGSSGLAFLAGGAIGYALSKSSQDKEKYKEMNPEEVLKAHKKNFAWRFDTDIESITLKDGMIDKKIIVRLTSHKKKILLMKKAAFENAKELLQQVAKDKIQ